jgi:hypothetical protein
MKTLTTLVDTRKTPLNQWGNMGKYMSSTSTQFVASLLWCSTTPEENG